MKPVETSVAVDDLDDLDVEMKDGEDGCTTFEFTGSEKALAELDAIARRKGLSLAELVLFWVRQDMERSRPL